MPEIPCTTSTIWANMTRDKNDEGQDFHLH